MREPISAHHPSLPARVHLEQERIRTIDALCAHFAQDHLDTPELERRLDLANRATSTADLILLRQDLPALPLGEAISLGVYSVERVARVPDQRTVVNVIGNYVRKGSWTPAAQMRVFALIGDIKLDFREARFGPEPVELFIGHGLGDIEIEVPPGVRLDIDMVSLFGDAVEETQDFSPLPADAPMIRIRGVKLVADLKVRERLPDPPAPPPQQHLGWLDRLLGRGI